MRYVLHNKLPYAAKDLARIGKLDLLIVGAPMWCTSVVEQPARF